MTITASSDITIDFEQDRIPIAQTSFNVPLIVAQSDEIGVPTGEYDVFTSLPALTDVYSRANSTRIADWAEYMFLNGARKVAVLNVDRGSTPTDSDLSTALGNIEGEDFFYVVMTSREGTDGNDPQGVSGDRSDVASWCDANDRAFIGANNVSETASDIKSDLSNNLQFDSTFFCAYENSSENLTSVDRPIDAALAGKLSAEFAGSVFMKYLQIDGIGASDYSSTEASDIESENGAVYLSKLGEPQVSQGKAPTGDWFDVSIIKLFLKARLTEAWFSAAVAQDKIPYDPGGIETVKGLIEDVFEKAHDNELIADTDSGSPDYDVQTPELDEIGDTDKTNRVLPQIITIATLAGAIAEVKLTVRFVP